MTINHYIFVENIPIRKYNISDVLCKCRRLVMQYLTTTEMAEKWNISRRRVAELCRNERINGAILKGKTWLIPSDATKPEDPRRNHN